MTKTITTTTTKWTEPQIKAKLSSDPRWVGRALIRLYERQTSSEQSSETTRNLNGIGFAPCDAFMFTRFAKYLLQNKNRTLSPKQLAYCGVDTPGYPGLRLRKWRGAPAIAKYAGQMLKVIEEDAARDLTQGFSAAGQNALRMGC